MGLYDSYRLSNSSAIPLYEGSTGDTAIKVGQYMQGLYDQGQQGAQEISGNVDNLKSLPWHEDAVNEVRNHVNDTLAGYAKQKDYENLVPDVQRLGKWYANRANELQAPVAQRQEYMKQLDEFNKGKEGELNSYQKQALLDMSDTQARKAGSPKDGMGRYKLSYTGENPDKNIDVNAKVDKLIKEHAFQEGGDEYVTGTDGDWLVKNGVKFKRFAPGTIQRIVQDGLSNDQEYQSYKAMQGKIDAHMNTKMIQSPDQLPDTIGGRPNTLKQQAIQLAAAHGIPFQEALKHVVSQNTQGQIDNTALDYATTKYQQNDRFNTMDVNGNPFALKKLEKDTTPWMVQGPNVSTTADEQDIHKLTGTVQDLSTQNSNLDKQTAFLQKKISDTSLPANVRSQYQADLNNAMAQKNGINAQLQRANQLMDYSKMKTAQGMGYDSYDAFKAQEAPKVESSIKSVYPSGIVSRSGVTLSAKDIADAVVDGRYKVDRTVTSAGIGSAATDVRGVTITTKDGKQVFIGKDNKAGELNDAIGLAYQANGSKLDRFNKQLASNHEANVKDFSVQSTTIALPEEDRKNLTTLIANEGTNYTKPGEFGILAKGDRPINGRVTGISDTRGPNGETRLQVQELDKDGKPTGNMFDALSSNSNISDIVARRMAKNKTPESQQAAEIMGTGSGADFIKNKVPGTEVPLGQMNYKGKPVNATIKIQRSGSTVTYDLTDGNGNIITSTTSSATAGQWIDRSK